MKPLRSHRRRLIVKLLGVPIIGLISCTIVNNAPIVTISAPDAAVTGSEHELTAVTDDLDGDPLSITWKATDGTFNKTSGEQVKWTAPLEIGNVSIKAYVDDRKQGIDSDLVVIKVYNNAPIINAFTASAEFVTLGNEIELSVMAEDLDGEALTYEFFTSPEGIGQFSETAEPNKVTWQAPTASVATFARTYSIVAKVTDEQNFITTDTLGILVYSEYGTIWVVDSQANTVTKYSAEGDFILRSGHAFQDPVAVANNINEFYGAYVADFKSGEIVKIGPYGKRINSFAGIPDVSNLAIHEHTETLWAISKENRSLTVINTYTEQIVKTVFGFETPHAIAINQNSGDVWITDITLHQVFKLNATDVYYDPDTYLPDTLTSANTTIFGPSSNAGDFLNAPIHVATKDLLQEDATIYLADRNDGQIERLIYNTSLLKYEFTSPITGLDRPVQVATTVNGVIWALTPSTAATKVSFYNELAPITPYPVISYAFENPQVIAVDKEDGDVWIGDNGTAQVVKLVVIGASQDSLAATINGVEFISDIVVNK